MTNQTVPSCRSDDVPLKRCVKPHAPEAFFLALNRIRDACRDRENSTVFVSGLWDGIKDEDLKSLFKDVSEMLSIFAGGQTYRVGPSAAKSEK